MTKNQRNGIFPLLVLLFLSVNVKSQSDYPKLPIDTISGKIIYTDVVYVDSTLLTDDLFTLARIWYAETFRVSGYVIQMEDKQAGVLIGKTNFPLLSKSLMGQVPLESVSFTFSLYFKNGRYKYEVSDFITHMQIQTPLIAFNDLPFENIYFNENLGNRKYNKKTRISFINQLDTQIKLLLNDLMISMNKKNSSIDSDW